MLEWTGENGLRRTGDHVVQHRERHRHQRQRYVARSGTITFAPGETTKRITVEVRGDSKRESNEVFYFDLFDLSGNALS